MPDRVSLVAVPRDRKSLSVALKFALRSYSKYVRKKGRRRGRVWKGRFSSCPVDPAYCRQVMLHVERLPVRAGLAGRAEQYLWSSAAAHAGKRKDPLVSGGAEANWAAWLRQPEGSRVSAAIERSARTGRPLGSNEFVVALERRLGRRLRPRKPGPRPKKKR
jgi:putative transposase